MNISLYEAANELAPLLDTIDEDGCIPPELETALAQFEGKGVAVTAYILNCEAGAKLIADASKAMAERAKPLQARADRLRQYLADNMKRTGIDEIKCPEFTAKFYAERDESVDVYDLGLVPQRFVEEKITHQPNKTAIKAMLKDGLDVPGARIVKKDRLTIK